MCKNSKLMLVTLWIIVIILASLACGHVQVGVVATPDATDQVAVEIPVTQVINVEETSPPEDTETKEAARVVTETTAEVIAWLGHIASMPSGNQNDDMFILSPAGTGEFGIVGITPEIDAEIHALRDSEGPNEFVYIWGELTCPAEDSNECQVSVDRLQYGAKYSEQDISNWIGTIKSHTFNGGLSHVFELSGEFPIWYSIHASQDETLQSQIASQRDTGSIVSVNGKLMVGVPDVNGTRIEVTNMEILEPGTVVVPTVQIPMDITSEWPVFVNEVYGYQIKYPLDATISLFGPDSFPSDELPDGYSPDRYLSELLELYTDKLCIRIEYSLGWIYISAPENQNHMYAICGPTGIGAGEITPKIESIYIGDQLYEANGYEVKLHVDDGSGGVRTGDTLDLHYEFFSVDLTDNTRINFGALPRNDATYEDYLMETKEVLLMMLSTYQQID